MRDAFDPLDPTGACLFVLTLDRHGTYSGEKRWPDAKAAYQDLSRLSNDFLKRLRKWMRVQGWDALGNEWVATVEAHKSGWPHVNFVLYAPQLAEWISKEKAARLREGMSERESNLVSGALADLVTESGWGLVSTAERARSREESLGYICKCAGKVDESIGELAKLTQLPTNAPFRFRRIRSGKGFLPPRAKNEAVTGTLIRRQHSNDGTRDVVPLHDLKDEAAIEQSEEACRVEERIWQKECEDSVRMAPKVKEFGRSVIELPPVTHWLRGVRLERKVVSQHEKRPRDNLFEPSGLLPTRAPRPEARFGFDSVIRSVDARDIGVFGVANDVWGGPARSVRHVRCDAPPLLDSRQGTLNFDGAP